MIESIWSRAEKMFYEALEVGHTDRENFVMRASQGDATLAMEVLSLLNQDASDGEDLDWVVQRQFLDWIKSEAALPSLANGTRLGPYLLLEQLHAGGMGTVHLAQRADQQYTQTVVIKAVRQGHASPELIRRFYDERQILATLQHPNVGTIFDGGQTTDGQPYLVMEYVQGEPITLYCQRRSLDIPSRLRLFQAVCSAVHHAHQRLILHRDIKPENVLVTNEGVPKLIDFGIAKSLGDGSPNDPASADPRLTHWLTLNYASPEQIQGKPLTVGSDIYSLGIVLFELLTDQHAYDISRSSLTEAEQIVLHGQMPKPSARNGNAKARRRYLSGDLDSIVAMALEKDPEHRYASARDLHDDVARFLEGRPVKARNGGLCYRIRKAALRHRSLVLSLSASLMVAALSYGGYRWKAERAERRAHHASLVAQATIDEMTEKALSAGNSTEAKAQISRRALDYLLQLESTIGADSSHLLTVSRLYIRAGDIEGLPSVANLGHSDEAIRSYQSALRIAEQADAKLHNDKSAMALLMALQRIAALHIFQGDVEGAMQLHQRALSRAYPYWLNNPGSLEWQQVLVKAYLGVGEGAMLRLAPDQAVENYQTALHVLGGVTNGEAAHDLLLADVYLHRSYALNELGRQEESLKELRAASAISQEVSRVDPSSKEARRKLMQSFSGFVLVFTGRDFLNTGDSRQALLYARRLSEVVRSLDSHDPTNVQLRMDTILGFTKMGDALRLSDPHEAAIWYRRALDRANALRPAYGSGLQHTVAILDDALAEVLPPQKQAERLALLKEHLSIRAELAKSSPHGNLHLMGAYCALARAELSAGDRQAAEQDAERAVPLLREYDPHSPSLMAMRNQALCLGTAGEVHLQKAMLAHLPARSRWTEAESAHAFFTRSDEIWRTWASRGATSPESRAESQWIEARLRSVSNLEKALPEF